MIEQKNKLSFNKINETVYASETELTHILLNYLKPEYKKESKMWKIEQLIL